MTSWSVSQPQRLLGLSDYLHAKVDWEVAKLAALPMMGVVIGAALSLYLAQSQASRTVSWA